MGKERKKSFKLALATGGILCLAALAVAGIKRFQNNNKTIDLDKYVTVAGYEGYGYLSLDWEQIEKEYGSISKELSSKIRCKCDEVIENGKTIQYSWDIPDEVKENGTFTLKYKEGSLKVESLEPVETIDAFDGVKLILSGYDSEGIAELDCVDAPLHYFEYAVSPNENLRNGDEVHVTIDEKRNAFILKTANKLPESYDKTFVVEGLEENGTAGTVLGDTSGDTLFLYDDNNQLIIPDENTIQKYDEHYSNTTFPGNRDIVQMLMNELLARKGYKFQTEEVGNYFNQFDWYKNISHDLSDDNDAISKLINSEKIIFDSLTELGKKRGL